MGRKRNIAGLLGNSEGFSRENRHFQAIDTIRISIESTFSFLCTQHTVEREPLTALRHPDTPGLV